ncbi:hypothetical protein KI659_07475 [Litoribacter alkaliphilus]|uniref:Integral membrane protein n=1 Tax=Litoribacter ruber TaxID=702568 RepID=A0AAP2G1A9_9BACT|nr:hypothetical protein [Litoribacter alkaliphilus]MBS9523852.1 hypothetical protein [Litoribacter alkaliphilus]
MKLFITDLILKLFFLFSLVPFVLSEKVQQRFDVRLNPLVEDSIFTTGEKVGEVDSKMLAEASGLAVSRIHPGLLYSHNDRGGKPDVHMIDSLGRHLGMIRLEGVKNRDWEDIAIGPGPEEGVNYIYVGAIGDNVSEFKSIQVHRFPEPAEIQERLTVKPETFTFSYPDGPKDSETMMVDPWNGDLYLLSKRDSSNILYKAPYEKLGPDPIVLEKVMELPITLSTGGDISADGKEILIKNYWVVYYWVRQEGETLEEALARKATQLPYKPEPQGEAIAFTPDAGAYYTLSEKSFRIDPILYKYSRKSSGK